MKRRRSSSLAVRLRRLKRRRVSGRPLGIRGKAIVRSRRKNRVRMGMGFPKQLNFTHRYVERKNLTGTGLQTFNISCNGMFAPTAAGHQPLFFDQISPLYNQYTVIGAKISVQFCFASPPTEAAGSTATPIIVPTECIVYLNDDTTTTPSNIFFLQEQGDVKKTFLGPGSDVVKTLTMGWSAKQYAGTGLISNPNFIGSAAVNPAEQYYFTVGVSALDLATSVSVQAIIQVDYIAVWTEPKDIANS